MSSTAQLELIAKSYTSAKQGDNSVGDRFRDNLRDLEKDDKNASKSVVRQLNLLNNSKQHMAVCGLSLQQGTTESRKTLERKFSFQNGTLKPHGINERFSLI